MVMQLQPKPQPASALRMAVIGAGPAGLALALLAARQLPWADITLFDARSADHDVRRDARTIALSLGSVQLLEGLNAWDARAAQAIAQVHVSQAPPTWGHAAVRISADEFGLPLLGAVLPYGPLVAQLQQAWEAAVAQDEARAQQAPHPQPRLHSRWGSPVRGLKALDSPGGVEVDAGIAERFDLAVVAEGGVFADQVRKSLRHDYAQTAWVGSVSLEGAAPGVAFERFTRQGPVALLPLPPLPPSANGGPLKATDSNGPMATNCQHDGTGPIDSIGPPSMSAARAALVWCVNSTDDPVRGLNDAQRLAVLQSLLPPEAGRVTGISALKHFPLGLNAERTLVQGRQVRIGNAAQTLHPVAGQGLNLGLRDAHALVQALRFLPVGAASAAPQNQPNLSTQSTQSTHPWPPAPIAPAALGLRPADLDAALRSVEWQRAPDRWSTIASTDFLARSFTWAWPGVAAARGLGLAALQAAPALRRALARQMMFGRR